MSVISADLSRPGAPNQLELSPLAITPLIIQSFALGAEHSPKNVRSRAICGRPARSCLRSSPTTNWSRSLFSIAAPLASDPKSFPPADDPALAGARQRALLDDSLKQPAAIDGLDQLDNRGLRVHLASLGKGKASPGAGEESEGPINRAHRRPLSAAAATSTARRSGTTTNGLRRSARTINRARA